MPDGEKSPAYEGRLELTWTNKHRALLSHEDGSYEWVDPSDYRVAEVRLLHDAGEVGEVGPGSKRALDNLLIRGDALHALRALTSLPEFAAQVAGQAKLIYIDPPFNTGQAFPSYDDGLEHSVWLTMMRDRLTQASELLHPEGSIWVHLDDAEVAYCRVLMDELFGRDNFVTTVIWEKADSPRNSARQFSTDHDYILVFSKNPEWKPNRLPRTAESDAIYTNPDDDPTGPWLPGDPYANKPYAKGLYKIEGPTGRTFEPPPGRFWRIAEEKFWELDEKGRIWWGPNRSARPSIKRYLSEVADLVPRTLWSKDEVGHNRRAKNEIRALFPGQPAFDTPKPEQLMARVMEVATAPGDLVIDFFAGSGSTAAVAQKMGRRWLTVERSRETIETYTMLRLHKVVEGADPGGITEVVGWEGGGGFRVLDVAPSMFEDDEGVPVLAGWAESGEQLAEATCAQLGFAFAPDGPFHGLKGRTRLAVVDGNVDANVVELLARHLGERERLMIAGTAVADGAEARLRELGLGSRIRKIPSSILAEYEQEVRWVPISLSEAAGDEAAKTGEEVPA